MKSNSNTTASQVLAKFDNLVAKSNITQRELLNKMRNGVKRGYFTIGTGKDAVKVRVKTVTQDMMDVNSK